LWRAASFYYGHHETLVPYTPLVGLLASFLSPPNSIILQTPAYPVSSLSPPPLRVRQFEGANQKCYDPGSAIPLTGNSLSQLMHREPNTVPASKWHDSCNYLLLRTPYCYLYPLVGDFDPYPMQRLAAFASSGRQARRFPSQFSGGLDLGRWRRILAFICYCEYVRLHAKNPMRGCIG
jgi:hypothetical protein